MSKFTDFFNKIAGYPGKEWSLAYDEMERGMYQEGRGLGARIGTGGGVQELSTGSQSNSSTESSETKEYPWHLTEF